MAYLQADFEDFLEDRQYRCYVGDSLQSIPQNKYLVKRFYDIINVEAETVTGEQVAESVIKRAGLRKRA